MIIRSNDSGQNEHRIYLPEKLQHLTTLTDQGKMNQYKQYDSRLPKSKEINKISDLDNQCVEDDNFCSLISPLPLWTSIPEHPRGST